MRVSGIQSGFERALQVSKVSRSQSKAVQSLWSPKGMLMTAGYSHRYTLVHKQQAIFPVQG